MPESYTLDFVESRPPVWGIPQTAREEKINYAPLGRTFYVHGTLGVDINDSEGLDKDYPLLTITNALSRCTASANDVINVLYYPSAGATGETWPININKRGVKLIGGLGEDWADTVRILRPPVGSAVSVPCIVVNADDVEIAGLWIEGLAAGGSTAGGIELGTTASFAKTHIHHCSFGWQLALQDGIRGLAGFDLPSLLVHDCVFNDKITRDGIRLSQNATRGLIYNNIFRGVAGIGINLQALCTDIYAVFGNRFRVPDAATGEAITCNAASLGCMFYENQTMQGVVAMGLVPYRDLGANHWGLNYYGLLAIMPVTV